MTKDEMLVKIAEVGFSALDLQLFLDTHPYNAEAIARYNTAAAESKKLKEAYEQTYGPLDGFRSSSDPAYFSWIDDPWPWMIKESSVN
ncbi:MAG: spore coat protein CotJB [Firmicutes bacterium]|nr:spore coat protein CotJB [Bacillota bacterium]